MAWLLDDVMDSYLDVWSKRWMIEWIDIIGQINDWMDQ
jgi:hypothetical protein